jgi:predicted PhzF superfamily epimerase YddE/YHI9
MQKVAREMNLSETAFLLRGVIITSRASQPGIDSISRFFAPAAGINEDPVTGSAHCCLAPFWGKKLCTGIPLSDTSPLNAGEPLQCGSVKTGG